MISLDMLRFIRKLSKFKTIWEKSSISVNYFLKDRDFTPIFIWSVIKFDLSYLLIITYLRSYWNIVTERDISILDMYFILLLFLLLKRLWVHLSYLLIRIHQFGRSWFDGQKTNSQNPVIKDGKIDRDYIYN